MRTHFIITTAIVTATLFTTGMVAQTENPTSAPAPAAEISPASPMPAPNSVIYIPRLPTPSELASAAAAQGLSIEKIEQTSAQITVAYKYANGQINTVAYQLLPAASAAPQTVAAPATVAPAGTATVIYTSPAPTYYYYDPFYYAWPWPVSFDIGIGYGFRHGGFGYGFRHFGGRGFNGGGRGFHGGGRGFHH